MVSSQLRLLRSGWLCLAGVVACLTSSAWAQSAAELRASGHQIAAEIASQKSAGRFDTAAQQRAVDKLGKLALGYIEVSDRAANVGGERREREALLGAYQAIAPPLEDIYGQNSAYLERAVKKVMDEDGDLEALYDTQRWKEAQLVASQALYFLNWLHYYGAHLYDGAQRQELLEKAERGFSEFAVGDRRTELLIESLLGRGLCYLELGKVEFAAHDLKAVIDDPQASPERKAKARLALLDAAARAGNVEEALRQSDRLLGSGGRAEDNVVRFLRIRALLAGAQKGGPHAEQYRQQALSLMDQLRKAGGGWEEKVAALAQTGIEDPEKWAGKATKPFAQWELAKLLVQKGDYKQAAPLLERFVSSSGPEVREHRGEAQYFLGLAEFQAGQYEEAAEHLTAALKEANPSYGADAAYMRFKAMEVLAAGRHDGTVLPAYEQAVREYLARYPDHRSAFEAQFRLGELLQAQHKFADAVQAYAKVHGDPGFELRAQFATLQCDFELLQAAPRPTAAQHAALLNDIGSGLQKFERQAAEYQARERKGSSDTTSLGDMQAKSVIMKAVYLNLQSEPQDAAVLAVLADFEKKYPEQKDLLPQVTRLRLAAYQHLGRFGEAEAEVRAHGPLLLASAGAPAVEDLAMGFIREGARRHGKGDAAANQAAQQVALHLYELLVSDSEGPSKATLTLARLYENTGELDKSAALYAEILKTNASSPIALRGLGRIAEAQNRLADAVNYWRQLASAVRPGDAPWYEGNYQVARLTHAMGKKKESCALLREMKPAMPGLSDADLRKKLDNLYQQACR
jgi:tetratricopeptide (TPR) repeat protein